MKFYTQIKTTDGSLRKAEFENRYDATDLLVAQIEGEILQPGEVLMLKPSPHESGPLDRRTQVPAIWRIA